MKPQRFTRAGNLILALLLPLALTGGRPALPAPAAVPEEAASLPLLAQVPISALIGADQSVYHARLDGTHFRMDNPEQGLSAVFGADGMQVSAGVHSWGLALEGYGYGESLQSLSGVDPTSRDNRIEYAHGPLTEWYLNGPFGLEQGFTLATPPAVMKGGPLTLALSQGGDLQAAVGAGGRELVLSAASGEAVLGYTGMQAQDADGRELPTWLESRAVVKGRPPLLLLRLDDHGARYPLTIDPFVQKAKLTASDRATSDGLGSSVAISGDVVVVGAPYAAPGGITQAGAAYVFVKPLGGWGDMTQTAKLTASDKYNFDIFGYSVAISGDVVVVGAQGGYAGDPPMAGAAYVFVKPAGGWANMTQTAKLTASDKATLDNFGRSVAISGNVVVVGAYYAKPGGITRAGAAYIFVKPGGGWGGNLTETAKLTDGDSYMSDEFGRSVAINGDVVVVGAIYARPGGTIDAGAAYVFVKPGGGWVDMTPIARLIASDRAAYDRLGWSVGVSGDVVVVGAPYAAPGGEWGSGAVYIFVKPADGWVNMRQTAKLTASDPYKSSGDLFGDSVAISGNVVVIGASFAYAGGWGQAGAAYIFVKPGSGWEGNLTETAHLTASDSGAHKYFASSVAISGNTVVVGAIYAAYEGAVYVFGKPGGGWGGDLTEDVRLLRSDNDYYFLFGQSVAIDSGVIVGGAPKNSTGEPINSGAAYMFDGSRLTSFRSQDAYDGNILESGESSGAGGTVNATATTFRVGDNGLDRQYRSILSFNTSSLPENAVITSVVIKIKKQGVAGTNPFSTHQGLKVDIRKPYFGTTLALVASDFQAAASKMAVGTVGSTPASGWYSVNLNSTAYAYVNKTGTTQFRLRFLLDDNDDMGDDYVMFYSGDWSIVGDRPLLMVQYYIP